MPTKTTNVAIKSAKPKTLTEKYNDLRATLDAVEARSEALSEAASAFMRDLQREDIGWAEAGVGESYKGLTLGEMKRWSDSIRVSLTGNALNAPNPHMRNGIMLRHSFIWQGGIHYLGIPGDEKAGVEATRGKKNVHKIITNTNLQRLVFGSSARRRRESALYSDGFYMLIGNDNDKSDIQSISLSMITDIKRDDFYEDEIIAYRITRNVAQREASYKRGGKIIPGKLTGERKHEHFWVYVDWFKDRSDVVLPDKIAYTDSGEEEDVWKDWTAFDFHANRPEGQAFGSPDAISALVWARIIRDLIMNGVKMQDALALFAFRVINPSKKSSENTALELGKEHEAGSTANLGPDQELAPLNTAGKGYDFGSIGFVVATMAASLHLSGIALSANTALAGSSYGAAKTLDLPGRMAMETRRAEHIEFDERLLRWFGADDATAYFNSYDDATDEYRAVQAAYLIWQSGNLSPEGFMAEMARIYGRTFEGDIPDGVMVPNNEKTVKKTTPAVKSAPAPTQGKSDGTGGADHVNDPKSTK